MNFLLIQYQGRKTIQIVKNINHRIKMGIIMSDIKYKKSHSLPKGAKPQIEITFIILTSGIKMKQIQI